MSDESITQQIEYEEVVENIDLEAVLEGTRWEDSLDEDEPFAKEFVGMLGAMGGYALGEILGRGVGGMVDRELEAMDERMSEDDDDQQQSDSSAGTSSDQTDDSDQQDAAVKTTTGQGESSSSGAQDEDESADEDLSEIGGDSI